MIKANVKIMWNKMAVPRAVNKGSIKALTRGAAYVRGVARRKIKRRKNKSSPPGHPPYEHRNFKNTIVFAVDPLNVSAYIGPRMTSGRKNASGQPVPNVLEFGGASIPCPGHAWWVKSSKADLRNVRSKSGVSAYLRSVGYGPLFMGGTQTGVLAAAERGRKHAGGGVPVWKDKIRGKYSPVLKKKVFYLSVRLKSDRQVSRAADNVIEYFGYPAVPVGKVAPRPFMGPTLEESKSKFAEFFRNIIH